MSRPTDKPMARANEHLASARYAEAAGAFRAVLWIDPNEFQAHFGLADALTANGQRREAVDGLVQAAESCNEQDAHAAALTLYGKALAIDPSRLELHLDVAMAEAALGRDEPAKSRLENLAEIYMQAGRTDEAAEVYRFLAGWEEDEEEDDDDDDDGDSDGAPIAATDPAAGVPLTMVASSETVVIPTILVTPDGQLLQMPVGNYRAPSTPAREPTSPAIPMELIEAAHSTPIDMAEGSGLADVEGTVVAFPPPPPQLPEGARATPTLSREALEAAVATAMENLAQIDNDDTVIMRVRPKVVRKRVAPLPGAPRRPTVATPVGMPNPGLTPPRPAAAASPALTSPRRVPGPAPRPAAAPSPAVAPRPADGKLRLRPAPRPASVTPVPSGPAPAPVRPRPQPSPRPAAAPPSRPAAARSARSGASPRPAAATPGSSAPGPRGPARPAAPATGGPAPAPVRPENPLVDRLRRRAGPSKQSGPGPRAAHGRTTASISVRSPADPDDDPNRT